MEFNGMYRWVSIVYYYTSYIYIFLLLFIFVYFLESLNDLQTDIFDIIISSTAAGVVDKRL